MPARLPGLLQEGDRVALLAPASPLPDPADLPRCVAAIEALGLQVKRYPTLGLRSGYMAGTPGERAADLDLAFRDPEAAGIFCLRGGYSTVHALPHLDWEGLRTSNRLFCGFSDLTALMTPLATRARLASLHAPTPSHLVAKCSPGDATFRALKRFLFRPWERVSYRALCGEDFEGEMLRPGSARGRILGGNLSVFASLAGTPWLGGMDEPVLLFLEDVGEPPYRLDRCLTQVLQSPLRRWIAGVVLGQFTDRASPEPSTTGEVRPLMERLLAPLSVPILAGLPVGHGTPSYPLPLGMEARIDGEACDLVL